MKASRKTANVKNSESSKSQDELLKNEYEKEYKKKDFKNEDREENDISLSKHYSSDKNIQNRTQKNVDVPKPTNLSAACAATSESEQIENFNDEIDKHSEDEKEYIPDKSLRANTSLSYARVVTKPKAGNYMYRTDTKQHLEGFYESGSRKKDFSKSSVEEFEKHDPSNPCYIKIFNSSDIPKSKDSPYPKFTNIDPEQFPFLAMWTGGGTDPHKIEAFLETLKYSSDPVKTTEHYFSGFIAGVLGRIACSIQIPEKKVRILRGRKVIEFTSSRARCEFELQELYSANCMLGWEPKIVETLTQDYGELHKVIVPNKHSNHNRESSQHTNYVVQKSTWRKSVQQ